MYVHNNYVIGYKYTQYSNDPAIKCIYYIYHSVEASILLATHQSPPGHLWLFTNYFHSGDCYSSHQPRLSQGGVITQRKSPVEYIQCM